MQRGPEAQLALALQGDGLLVDRADHGHVEVQLGQQRLVHVVEGGIEDRVGVSGAVLGEDVQGLCESSDQVMAGS